MLPGLTPNPALWDRRAHGGKLQETEAYLGWAFKEKAAPADMSSVLSLALEELLTELEDFLKILDQENLSSTAVVKKSILAELLRLYTRSSSE